VFEDGLLTLAQMREAISSDFAGKEPLRHLLSEKYAKYGNDDDGVDALFCRIADFLVEECRRHRVPFDSHLIPSVFCWVMHERLGRETPATPDGRVAGFPLGDGSGPCQGRERKGPTASVLSSTKWDHAPFIGGVAVNMKFSKSTLGPTSLETMASLIRVFMERGGFELQINVLDRALLEQACEHPEQYRDLVVRIGGYSDYFTRLSPEMRSEVILRTEHKI
jgi:formate C-acetyltransferase